MATAIVVSNSEGVVGRCDARCHNAKSPDCDCICGGRLHGTGENAIEQNTRDWFGDDYKEKLAAFAAGHGLKVGDLTLSSGFAQLDMIGGAP